MTRSSITQNFHVCALSLHYCDYHERCLHAEYTSWTSSVGDGGGQSTSTTVEHYSREVVTGLGAALAQSQNSLNTPIISRLLLILLFLLRTPLRWVLLEFEMLSTRSKPAPG